MTSSTVPYSVSEITTAIKDCLKQNFGVLKVEGEISDFTHYQASGHMYFSLADEDATLQAVMFRRVNEKLSFEPEEGMTVVAEGRLDVYEKRGNYQLIVEKLESRGAGALDQEFQELKEKLEEEGALEPSRKRELPPFPTTVGVVTSGDGAAFWDIVRTIERRCPLVRIVLYPVRVNGRDSGDEIARGIERLAGIVDLDCMIVGRGGGSPEDLWGFNTEVVARAILESPVPVVSAVGHEIDVTISDLVADHRSPTPTAAGEEIVPSISELSQKVNDRKRRIRTAFQSRIDRDRDSLRYLSEKQVFVDLEGLLQPFKNKYEQLRSRIKNSFRNLYHQKYQTLGEIKGQFESLNPTSVLERGFALTYKDGELVKSVEEIEKSDPLTIQWKDGSAKTIVQNIEPDQNDSNPN